MRCTGIGYGLVMVVCLMHLGAGAAQAAETNGVTLVEKGVPAAVIVLPDDAGENSIEQQSANLLARFIEQMSGARPAVKRERELSAMHVVDGEWIVQGQADAAIMGQENVPGEAAAVIDDTAPQNFIFIGEGALVEELEVSREKLGPGGIRVKTVGNAVVLLGGPTEMPGVVPTDPNGVRYATIELLRRLGCRYLWPGQLGLVVPARTTVVVEPLDVTYTPQIQSRSIRWSQTIGRSRPESGLGRLGLSTGQWKAGHDKALGDAPAISWPDWHRLGGNMPLFYHNGGGLRHGEKHLQAHPDWFALQADGTRWQGGDSRWRLCVSNPELIKHVAKDIIQQVNEDPNIKLISLSPNDGGSNTGWCLCKRCEALDPSNAPKIQLTTFGERIGDSSRRKRIVIEHASLTDRMVHYWSAVAERVTEVHPNLLFGVESYSAFAHPPVRETLHPNLVVRYVPSHTRFVEGWAEAGAKRILWRPNILLANRRGGKLRSIVGHLARNMHYFARAGIVQTDFDSILHHWATIGLSYYAAARLNWNPSLEAATIIADFARAGFGAGAPYIEQYFHRVEQLTEAGITRGFDAADDRAYTPQVLAELREMLDAADHAADDPVVSERIAFLRMGLNFTELHETLDMLSWRAKAGHEVDDEYARRLIDLNCLALRDIILNHNLAVNTAYTVWGTGTFAAYSPIGGRTVTLSDEALLDRLDDPQYGLTGHEESLDEMLAAFGL